MSFDSAATIELAPITDEAAITALIDALRRRGGWEVWDREGQEADPSPEVFAAGATLYSECVGSLLYYSSSLLPRLRELRIAYSAEQEPGDCDEGPCFGEWAIFVPGVGEACGDDVGPDGRVLSRDEVIRRLDEAINAGHGRAADVAEAIYAWREELARGDHAELRAAFAALRGEAVEVETCDKCGEPVGVLAVRSDDGTWCGPFCQDAWYHS